MLKTSTLKKFVVKLATAIILSLFLSINLASLSASAAPSLPLPGSQNEATVTNDKGEDQKTTTNIYKEEGLIPTPAAGKSGQDIVRDLVFSGLSYVKVITVAVGILYITVLGAQLVINGNEEETVTNVKRGLSYTIAAFILISMSQDFGKIFDMQHGTLFESPEEILKRIRLFDRQVEIFLTFTKYSIGGYATLMIVRSAAQLLVQGTNEEETTKHKKSIAYSIGGLLLLNLGEIFINKVFYKVDKDVYTGITGVHPGLDAKEGVSQIVGITNLIVTFAAPIAVLMLIIGAILYATAGGEEEQTEKAKRLILATVIGIVIIYAAFAIVSTVISGRLGNLGALINE